jgi:hypothetical protein
MMGLRIESHITIVGNSSVPFELCGLEVLLPWKKEPAYLLPDPADYFAPQTYKFPNEKTGGYDRSDVIARSNVILRRGQTISGFLLGYDCQPIPDGFSDGSRLPITLNIINQLGESHQRELILPINRSQEWGPQPVPRPRRDLFAKRDEPKTRAEKVPAEKVPAEKEYAAR